MSFYSVLAKHIPHTFDMIPWIAGVIAVVTLVVCVTTAAYHYIGDDAE